jgi:hypothetical protein
VSKEPGAVQVDLSVNSISENRMKTTVNCGLAMGHLMGTGRVGAAQPPHQPLTIHFAAPYKLEKRGDRCPLDARGARLDTTFWRCA